MRLQHWEFYVNANRRRAKQRITNCSGEFETSGSLSCLDTASGLILKLFSALSLWPHYVSAAEADRNFAHSLKSSGLFKGDRIQYKNMSVPVQIKKITEIFLLTKCFTATQINKIYLGYQPCQLFKIFLVLNEFLCNSFCKKNLLIRFRLKQVHPWKSSSILLEDFKLCIRRIL